MVAASDSMFQRSLKHHLPVKETAAGKVRVPTNSPKFKTLSPLIKTYASSLHSSAGKLSLTLAHLRLTLQSFEPLLPFLLQFRKFLKVVIKSICAVVGRQLVGRSHAYLCLHHD